MAFLAATSFVVLLPADASAGAPQLNIDGQVTDGYADLRARRDGSELEGPGRSTRGTARRLIRTYAPACQGNLPTLQQNGGATCAQAFALCRTTEDPQDLAFWIYTAPAGPPAPGPNDWTATGETICRGSDQPISTPEPVVTARDFRRLPIPASTLKIQPASGETLINIPTNLYAASQPVVLPTTILGTPVRVRATPHQFRWTYGDGTTRTTTDAGAPYPTLRTAHTYQRPGRTTVELTTTYTGEYSITGGPWQPINGTATVPSPPATLIIHESRNQLVTP